MASFLNVIRVGNMLVMPCRTVAIQHMRILASIFALVRQTGDGYTTLMTATEVVKYTR